MKNLLRAGLTSLLVLQPPLAAEDGKAGKTTKPEKPEASSICCGAWIRLIPGIWTDDWEYSYSEPQRV